MNSRTRGNQFGTGMNRGEREIRLDRELNMGHRRVEEVSDSEDGKAGARHVEEVESEKSGFFLGKN